jgi:hypothetical protein
MTFSDCEKVFYSPSSIIGRCFTSAVIATLMAIAVGQSTFV